IAVFFSCPFDDEGQAITPATPDSGPQRRPWICLRRLIRRVGIFRRLFQLFEQVEAIDPQIIQDDLAGTSSKRVEPPRFEPGKLGWVDLLQCSVLLLGRFDRYTSGEQGP